MKISNRAFSKETRGFLFHDISGGATISGAGERIFEASEVISSWIRGLLQNNTRGLTRPRALIQFAPSYSRNPKGWTSVKISKLTIFVQFSHLTNELK
jgi:hypothetical protein